MNEPKIIKYYQVVDEEGSTIGDAHTIREAHKILFDYLKSKKELCGTCMLTRKNCQCDVFNENGRFK